MSPTSFGASSASRPVLVNDGSGRGITIIPSSTPLTRLNYFDGKFLRAADFQLDQAYTRALVALTARGAGSGLVNGFEAELARGDSLLLRAGLALSASGTVIDLPGDVTVSITQLLARADSVAVAPGSPATGNSSFGPCEAVTATSPDVVLAGQPIYLLTVASEEALCGEEERFDQLCTDACLTETDRPRRVEGIRLQAHRLDLGTLPVSSSVTFTAAHLRSQVATAYFAAEREIVAGRLSASGLLSSIWCAGADAVTGDEVPIGVLGRNGDATTFLDLWTARRELMEPPAQRYWAGRMTMRPWDVMLAQVLQFQCQLAGLGSAALSQRAATSAGLTLAADAVRGLADEAGGALADPGRLLAARQALGPDLVNRLLSLREDAGQLLGPIPIPIPLPIPVPVPVPNPGPIPGAGSAGALVNAGLVTLPPYGFIPIDLNQSVTQQLPPVFGDGVDLRFAAAPADHLPEIMRQAQDLNRISLTAGLDDPAAREPVDIIVPDGQLSTGATSTLPTYSGSVRILPQERTTGPAGDPRVTGSVTVITGVARDRSDGNVSWAAAGHTEIPQRVPFTRAVDALLRRRATPGAQDDRPVELPITTDDHLDQAAARPEFAHRINRERLLARARRIQVDGATADAARLPDDMKADRPIAATDARTMDLWLDFTINVPLADAKTGDQARLQGTLAAYSRASQTPKALEFTLDGTLTVIDRVDQSRLRSGLEGSPRGSLKRPIGAAATTAISSRFTGTLTLREFGDTTETQVNSIAARVDWNFVRSGGQTRLTGISKLVITQDASRTDLVLGADVSRTVQGLAGSIGSGDPAGIGVRPAIRIASGWQTAATGATQLTGVAQTLATFDLPRDDQALTSGRPERDLAESVIESIGAGLAGIDRDPGFVTRARGLLLPALPDAPSTLTATRDWVMFTRRRDVRYLSDSVETPPVVTRSYLVYHAVVQTLDNLDQFQHPAASQGFQRVGVVEFTPGSAVLVTPLDAVQTAFAAQPRGSRLLLQMAADGGNADGETVLGGRLAAYRGAVAGLIDTASVEPPQLLDQVPADFISSGIDGVLFTVGYQPPAKLGTHVMFGLTPAERERVDGLARQLGGWTALTLDKLQSVTDILRAPVLGQFTGEAAANADEVAAWWANQSAQPPTEIVLHVAAAADSAGDSPLEQTRASSFSGGTVAVLNDEVIEKAGDSQAVALWIKTDEQPVVTAGQLLVSLTKDEAGRLDLLARRQGGYPSLNDDQMKALVSNSPVFAVTFEGGQIAEPERVRDWWASTTGSPPDAAFVHPGAAADVAQEVDRASQVTELLGGGRAIPRDPVGGAVGENAVVYVIHP